jgi:hypothetical protein
MTHSCFFAMREVADMFTSKEFFKNEKVGTLVAI